MSCSAAPVRDREPSDAAGRRNLIRPRAPPWCSAPASVAIAPEGTHCDECGGGCNEALMCPPRVPWSRAGGRADYTGVSYGR